MFKHKILISLLALVVSFVFVSTSAISGQSIKFGPVVGGGVSNFVAGVSGIADVADPRDTDGDGTYDNTVACTSSCTFESSTGNLWYYDTTTTAWKCQTCRVIEPYPFNSKFAGSSMVAELCLRIWGVLPLAMNAAIACSTSSFFNAQFPLIGVLDSAGEANDKTYVLERLCFKAYNAINGTRGVTISITDDNNTTHIAELLVPEIQSSTLAIYDTACSNSTPVLVDKDVNSNLIQIVVLNGPNCADGSGCIADFANGFLTVLLTEL